MRPVLEGSWVRQRCRVSCVTGASNWYRLTVEQGLLSSQQVRVERECFYFFCFFTVIHFHFSPVPSLSSPISLLLFSWRQHKMTHKGWRVVKSQHNQSNSLSLSVSLSLSLSLKYILCQSCFSLLHMINFVVQDPVVRSIVSNAMQKLFTFFQQKISMHLSYFNIEILNEWA